MSMGLVVEEKDPALVQKLTSGDRRGRETLDRCGAAASDTNDHSESARTVGIRGLLHRCHCQLGRLRDRAQTEIFER
jgi:hypothetical protein